MLIKRFLFLRLSLSCCLTMFIFVIFFTSLAQAKTYSTALLDLASLPLEQLSWTISTDLSAEASSSANQEFKLAFIPFAISPSTSLNEQILTNYTCQKKEVKTTCQLSLTNFHQAGNFQFQYPDEANFYLNFHLKQSQPQEIFSTENQLLTYSPIKNISPSLQPTQLSWQETSYTTLNQATASAQSLLFQYKSASSSAQAWSSWQGNFSTLAELPLINSVASTTSALLWSKVTSPAQTTAFLQLQYFTFDHTPINLTYKKNGQEIISPLSNHYLFLAQPAVIGNQEDEAFAKTSFYLQDIQDLQLGQDIILQEEVNQTLYRLQGTIIDLKASTGLVTVDHWQGAIPLQDLNLCQNQRFCFSSQAKVALIEDFLLEFDNQAKNPLTFTDFTFQSEQPASIVLLSAQLNKSEPSLCLEKNQSFCTLQALNFNFSVPPSLLQYRVINFHPNTIKLENVFLHQLPISATNNSSTFHYLRHGKTLDQSGIARPYYW